MHCRLLNDSDGMTLQQTGVEPGSKIILVVKEPGSAERPLEMTSSNADDAGTSTSPKTDLQKELMSFLLQHFSPADAQKVANEFHKARVFC